ncbi:alpha-amylase, putative [Entamoeba invadens IP1]|uniref:Alpha-amylase, putative n=1 Tax=Entamoeba invadens TaxID=33085 RepID=S0B3V0_ENTIV|nr:alpha-amylase, putative [Entamoeba invadens IP1]ELP93883.1 alpha-amylase, putative [Entamoeba invadens IP1]BAN40423.1 alpha-amylase, putative [Entamoeba invadens]BAN40512.1 alpha-amylase, putative [Entamoeba invadens]BAN40930.1 alpha-amylase, putative [Entamoeba invadens]|eukprot:XP_004260654.1 alpha-amylase, putative [Entamoeba invadens IP1]
MLSRRDKFNYGNIYHILVDRFSGDTETTLENKQNSNDFLGGTLRGITSRMKYLKLLGTTTIFLSPIYQNHTKATEQYQPYHGYHIVNFSEVDSRFGTKEDFSALCRAAHDNGISVLLDVVPNHVSCYHPWVVDANNNINKEYLEWYSDGTPQHFLDCQELWKINAGNPVVKNALFNAFLEFFELGADDFRVDHAIGMTRSFFKELRNVLRERAKALNRPRPLLIGEVWFGGCEYRILETIRMPMKGMLWWISYFGFDGICQELSQMMYIGALDGVLDIRGCMMIRSYVLNEGMYRYTPLWIFKIMMWLRKLLYPRSYLSGLFVDNHDVDRIMYTMGGDVKKVKKAFEFVRNDSEPMIVYYGTEIGMSQVASKTQIGDIAMRAPMNWSLTKNYGQSEMFDFMQTCWMERKEKARSN